MYKKITFFFMLTSLVIMQGAEITKYSKLSDCSSRRSPKEIPIWTQQDLNDFYQEQAELTSPKLPVALKIEKDKAPAEAPRTQPIPVATVSVSTKSKKPAPSSAAPQRFHLHPVDVEVSLFVAQLVAQRNARLSQFQRPSAG